MTRYIAFLRAINLGGHTVKMETLRQLFESFGFSDVETFIASGNVIFQTTAQGAAVLEAQIASGLQTALGYEVAAFVRTADELAQIASTQPFPQEELAAAGANTVIFLHAPLDDTAKQKLMNLTTDIDRFASHAREVYWLCHKIQSQSTFSNSVLEKTLGVKSTIRGVNTISRLADRVASRTSTVGG
jgi:uncharacterized protein (DUF1697 family)